MDHFQSNFGAMSLLQQADAQGFDGDHDMLKILYGGSMLLMAGMVVGIFFNRGPFVIFGIIAYLTSLSTMTIAVKDVFHRYQFNFPKLVTASHFFFSGLVCFSIMYYNYLMGSKKFAVPSPRSFLTMILPIAIGFSLSVGINNIALMYCTASFAEMIGGASPLFVIAICLAEGKVFNLKLLMPVLGVLAGVCACASGEVQYSLIGLVLVLLATLLRAYKSHLQHQLMADSVEEKLEPIELLAWMSPPCFGLMIIWAAVTEGFAEPMAMLTGKTGLPLTMAIALTIVNACVLNVANNFVIRDLGAVGCLLAGQLKGILVLMGSVALLDEAISVLQIIGYVAIASSVYWYNKIDREIADREAISSYKFDPADLEKTPLVK